MITYLTMKIYTFYLKYNEDDKYFYYLINSPMNYKVNVSINII